MSVMITLSSRTASLVPASSYGVSHLDGFNHIAMEIVIVGYKTLAEG